MRSDATSGPDALDFWLGDWSCTWDGGHGSNRVARELDGHVVVERFECLAPERWSGISMSVLDRSLGRWRQTWVDSTGNYWALDEGRDGDDLTFEVHEIETGDDGSRVEVRKRMVFSDIDEDAFRWRWERSEDAEDTWEPLWVIDYHRAAAV
jgi:hypothetical protein